MEGRKHPIPRALGPRDRAPRCEASQAKPEDMGRCQPSSQELLGPYRLVLHSARSHGVKGAACPGVGGSARMATMETREQDRSAAFSEGNP